MSARCPDRGVRPGVQPRGNWRGGGGRGGRRGGEDGAGRGAAAAAHDGSARLGSNGTGTEKAGETASYQNKTNPLFQLLYLYRHRSDLFGGRRGGGRWPSFSTWMSEAT